VYWWMGYGIANIFIIDFGSREFDNRNSPQNPLLCATSSVVLYVTEQIKYQVYASNVVRCSSCDSSNSVVV